MGMLYKRDGDVGYIYIINQVHECVLNMFIFTVEAPCNGVRYGTHFF